MKWMPIMETDWQILVKLKDLINSLWISSNLKTKSFAEIFPEKSYLGDTGNSQAAFANLKHDTPIPPKTVFKRAALDSSKVSSLDCITVMVLKTCEPELLYILVDFFHMCFPDYWKVLSVVVVFKNVGD